MNISPLSPSLSLLYSGGGPSMVWLPRDRPYLQCAEDWILAHVPQDPGTQGTQGTPTFTDNLQCMWCQRLPWETTHVELV